MVRISNRIIPFAVLFSLINWNCKSSCLFFNEIIRWTVCYCDVVGQNLISREHIHVYIDCCIVCDQSKFGIFCVPFLFLFLTRLHSTMARLPNLPKAMLTPRSPKSIPHCPIICIAIVVISLFEWLKSPFTSTKFP